MQSSYLVYLGYLDMAIATAFCTFTIKCVLFQYPSYSCQWEKLSSLALEKKDPSPAHTQTRHWIIKETRHILQQNCWSDLCFWSKLMTPFRIMPSQWKCIISDKSCFIVINDDHSFSFSLVTGVPGKKFYCRMWVRGLCEVSRDFNFSKYNPQYWWISSR